MKIRGNFSWNLLQDEDLVNDLISTMFFAIKLKDFKYLGLTQDEVDKLNHFAINYIQTEGLDSGYISVETISELKEEIKYFLSTINLAPIEYFIHHICNDNIYEDELKEDINNIYNYDIEAFREEFYYPLHYVEVFNDDLILYIQR